MKKLTSILLILWAANVSSAQDIQRDLDLPILPPVYNPQHEYPAPDPLPYELDLPDEPPPVIYGEEINSSSDSVIYVVDISASMSHYARLIRAKEELARSIGSLPTFFRFNIIAYNCGMNPWAEELQMATPMARANAIDWVNQLTAAGGTGTGQAVVAALQESENQAIVLLTDGSPGCYAVHEPFVETHRRWIREANTHGTTITVFGIGLHLEEARAFSMGVAADSGGSYYDVP